MGTPDQLLTGLKRQRERQHQGRLKIYLGMVAGVGKTYAMLKGAHALKAQGEDVVIGYLETHGRLDTIAQIGDLETVPRKKLGHRSVELEEMDLDAVLARRPQVVLVDEFAHTNAPGSRHPKRYQDVLELLGHGIDVHTTLNVQHIQSRTDAITRISGIAVQEIVPDALIDRADEMVLIDQNPDEILERLRQGKIYGKEKAQAAEQNFFKASNLTALRELGLRLMAERVDHELAEMKSLEGSNQAHRSHHHLLVAVFGSPFSEYLMRWTRRQADTLHCPWSAVYVHTSAPLSDEEEALLRRNLETARNLGGELVEIQDDDVVRGILSAARQQGATQIIVGKPRPAQWWKLWRPQITRRLVYGQREIDVHVISPPPQDLGHLKLPLAKQAPLPWPKAQALIAAVGVVTGTTLLNLLLLDLVAYHALGLIYMLTFSLAAIFLREFSIALAAGLSALLWNFIFIPPRFTFAIAAKEDWIMLLLYVVTAGVIGTFTHQKRSTEERLRQQAERMTVLYRLSRSLGGTHNASETIHRALEEIRQLLGASASVWALEGKSRIEEARAQGTFDPDEKERTALHWAYLNRRPAGKFTETLPALSGHYLPLVDQTGAWGVLGIEASKLKEISTEARPMLEAIVHQLTFALGRDDLFRQLQRAQVREESEKIYRTLMNSVSHELRTPITAIQGFADSIDQSTNATPRQKEAASEILRNVSRLDQVVRNFLDMGRLEAGQLKLRRSEYDLNELIAGVTKKWNEQATTKRLSFHPSPTPLLVQIDGVLIAQAIDNVVQNALAYTPAQSAVELALSVEGPYARITVSDEGPGLGGDPEQVFEKFWRANPGKTGGSGLGLSIARAFVELHGGSLSAKNNSKGGATFKFSLPLGNA